MITFLIIIFITGYLLIAMEHTVKINKTATALVTGVLLWTVYIVNSPDPHLINEELILHIGELSGILFFLMGAMTIVELIDAHDGFDLITNRITQTDKRKLLWIVSFITFFLSAVLDNLTTTIVMVSLLRKLINGKDNRLFFIGIVIIAANAGGAWSPVGDVTTTMLWIGNQITTKEVIFRTFLPSLVCLLTPLIILSYRLKGHIERPIIKATDQSKKLTPRQQSIVFIIGVSILILVPVFKTLTHLPPFMGILFGLGILWIVTELLHGDKDDESKHVLSVVEALRKIDSSSILFFLGILISIASLQSTGLLSKLAEWMTLNLKNENLIVLSLGVLSSIVDNVPLVAATQGMYDLTVYPTDHYFWELLAYATGTGGSILVIGSAAGIAAMGMEKISFFWYFKRISLLAFFGYLAGAVTYILQEQIL